MVNFYNELIRQCIDFKKPFCVGKLGETEARNILNIINTRSIRWSLDLEVNAGVFPLTEPVVRDWAVEWVSSLGSLDLVLQWSSVDKLLIDAYTKGAILCKSFGDIDPFMHGPSGWHYNLHDRRLCVVHPMKETIESQIPLFAKIWPGARLGEVVCVKSPYPPAIEPGIKRNSYQEELAKMKEEIERAAFDVCIVGAGAYSLPLCAHAKKLGKVGIHLGGGTQLLFGIRGGRWDGRVGTSWEGEQFYATSEYWRHPLASDIPRLAALVEGACYW